MRWRRPRRARRNTALSRDELREFSELRALFSPRHRDPEADPFAPHLATQREVFEKLKARYAALSDEDAEALEHLARTAHVREPLTTEEKREYARLLKRGLTRRSGLPFPPLSGAGAEQDEERHRGLLEEARQAHQTAVRQQQAAQAASEAEARRAAWYETPEGQEAHRTALEAKARAEAEAAAEVRAAERAAARARSAELAEYQEDTRTGPRPKMPPALEVTRLVDSAGAGFTIRDYPPELIGNELCGNPIDGKAYYFIVSRQTRASTTYVKWETVERAAAQAGIQPQFLSFDVRIENSIDRDVVLRQILSRLDDQPLLPILQARAEVLAGPMNALRRVTSGTIPVQRGQTVAVRVVVPAPAYLAAMHEFFLEKFIPEQKKKYRIEVFPSRELPTHVIRQKQGARARRGLKAPDGPILPGRRLREGEDRPSLPASGSTFERAEFVAGGSASSRARVKPEQKVSHPEFGDGKVEALTTAGMEDGSPAAMVRFADGRARKVAVASLDSLEAPLDFAAREVQGRAQKPKKASTATSKGDLAVNYGWRTAGEDGLTFFRQAKKGSSAVAQFNHFRPFADRDFEYHGGDVGLVEALARTAEMTPDVAFSLIVSGCVRVNGNIVINPQTSVRTCRLSIRCAPKNNSPYFSWVPAYLPRSDTSVECVTTETQQALIQAARSQPQNYSVYMTMNPVLFSYTRSFWSNRYTRGVRRSDEGLFTNLPLLHDIDSVGRYGATLGVVQHIAARAASEGAIQDALARVFQPALDARMLDQLLSGTQPGRTLFTQMWGVGQTYHEAKANVLAFIQQPEAWIYTLKRNVVDRAVPRILRTHQIGLPSRRLWRLKPTSNPQLLRKALYQAVNQTLLPPGQDVSDADTARLLRHFQARPPSFSARSRSGKMTRVSPSPLPATGEFDAATVAVLNRVLNAPAPPPQGARPIPQEQQWAGSTTAPELEAYLGTLQATLAEIDGALAALGPEPYALRTDGPRGPGLNLTRPGLKRRFSLE